MDYRANKRVPLGQVLISPLTEKHAKQHGHFLQIYLAKHARGEWGDAVDEDEWRANDIALRTGGKVMSAYTLSCGEVLRIDTDGGRYTTLVQVADEDEDDC